MKEKKSKKSFPKISLIPATIKDKFNEKKKKFEEFPEKTNSLSNLSSTNVYVRQLKRGIRDKSVNTIALLGEFSSGKSSIIQSSLNSKKTLYIFPNKDCYSDGSKKQLFLDSLTKSDISTIGPNSKIYGKYIKNRKLIKLWSIVIFVSIFISLLLFAFMQGNADKFKEIMSNFLGLKIELYWYCLSPILLGIFICILRTLYICNYSISFETKNSKVT